MPYLGNTPTTQSFISGTDYFNGTGSQTAFTLSRTVASVNDIQAVVNNVVQVPNDAYTISGTTITFTSAPSAGTQNVYVRYLSTTTQAITPSQNTVSWSTLDSNVQGDLGISFKNKIINGNMVIAQRGTSSTPSASTDTYTIDRWEASMYVSTGTYSITQSSVVPNGNFTNSSLLTVTSAASPSGTNYAFYQTKIEGYNIADLGWGTANAKTVTISFWVRSSVTGTYSFHLINGAANYTYLSTFTISAANTWQYVTLTVPGPTAGSWLTTNGVGVYAGIDLGSGSSRQTTANTWTSSSSFFCGTSSTVQWINNAGATLYITGVQLEVGTQATTFTTAGGSYGAELALCQRYYAKMNSTVSNGACGAGVARSSTASNVFIKLPVTMRVIPTVSYSSAYLNYNSDVYQLVNGNSGVQGGTDSINYFPNSSTASMSTGQAVLLAIGSGGYVDFSSEL